MSSRLPDGHELGHYRILGRLGSGGMADVYRAEDLKLGREVALKVLPPEFGRNENAVSRFQSEVRSSASLNHRNIVTVFEVGEHDGLHYYAMRLLSGGDLRHRINAGMRPDEALWVLREIADAFVQAHGRGFVHRDVTPGNIMFDEQGHPVLTDFGIAKALQSSSRLTATGASMGTPRYMSPEQARGRPVDARADLYSLGVVLYEMLTGQPPFDAEEALALIFKHVTEPVPRLPESLAPYQDLVDGLLAKDPDERIASAEALIDAIEPLMQIAQGGSPAPGTGGADQDVRTQQNPTLRQSGPRTSMPRPPATRATDPGQAAAARAAAEQAARDEAARAEQAAREKAQQEAEAQREATERAERAERERLAAENSRKAAEEKRQRDAAQLAAQQAQDKAAQEQRAAEEAAREEANAKQAAENARQAEEKRRQKAAADAAAAAAAEKAAEEQAARRAKEAEEKRQRDAALAAEKQAKAQAERERAAAEKAQRDAAAAAAAEAQAEQKRQQKAAAEAAAEEKRQRDQAERERKAAAATAAAQAKAAAQAQQRAAAEQAKRDKAAAAAAKRQRKPVCARRPAATPTNDAAACCGSVQAR